MIVENRPGASGNLCLGHVARSPADGYTPVITPGSITYAGPLFKATFDPFRDFTPVVMLISPPC